MDNVPEATDQVKRRASRVRVTKYRSESGDEIGVASSKVRRKEEDNPAVLHEDVPRRRASRVRVSKLTLEDDDHAPPYRPVTQPRTSMGNVRRSARVRGNNSENNGASASSAEDVAPRRRASRVRVSKAAWLEEQEEAVSPPRRASRVRVSKAASLEKQEEAVAPPRRASRVRVSLARRLEEQEEADFAPTKPVTAKARGSVRTGPVVLNVAPKGVTSGTTKTKPLLRGQRAGGRQLLPSAASFSPAATRSKRRTEERQEPPKPAVETEAADVPETARETVTVTEETLTTNTLVDHPAPVRNAVPGSSVVLSSPRSPMNGASPTSSSIPAMDVKQRKAFLKLHIKQLNELNQFLQSELAALETRPAAAGKKRRSEVEYKSLMNKFPNLVNQGAATPGTQNMRNALIRSCEELYDTDE